MSAKARFRLQTKPSPIAGLGVFAMEDIPWGVKIVEFTGALIDDAEAERRAIVGASAIMELGEGMNIDGFEHGGIAAMINHRRRAPNCCLLRDEGKIWIVAGVEGVSAGEELTYDYGSDYYPKGRRAR
jgi:SET domain-containing protein